METKNLTPITELVKTSFRIYFKKENLIFATKFAAIYALIFIIPALFLGLLASAGFSVASSPEEFFRRMGASTIAVAVTVGIVYAFAGVWVRAATIKVVTLVAANKKEPIKKVFADVWPKLLKFFLVGLMGGLATAVGLIVFIIPGVVIGIWFSFAGIILIVEGTGVTTALTKSRNLVRGYFWPTLVRLVVFTILGIVIQAVFSSIKLVGPIALALISPFYSLLPYLLYKDLKRIKESAV